jgi:C4-dicarboxylate-specific signal transduction histidine kinase
MKAYRDLGIQKKMQVMTLLICGAVVLVAMASLFPFQVLAFRSNFKREAMTLSFVVANNSTAAMSFGDKDRANEVISALKAEPTVISARIPAESMSKIFSPGFTTKQDGHGFGLLSGANAAKEMGAQLTAHSDGPGQGAEFTLVLPVATNHLTAKRSFNTESI